jgi:formate dehydrogenase iron-sulfur subunit
VVTCPFGVIDRSDTDGRAAKCTLCYDRQKGGLEPACAKACPTDSIQFGEVAELRAKAEKRVAELHERGVTDAYIYGTNQPGTEGLNAIFLLVDRPEVYNLPVDPVVPTKRVVGSWIAMGAAALGIFAAAIFSTRSSR